MSEDLTKIKIIEKKKIILSPLFSKPEEIETALEKLCEDPLLESVKTSMHGFLDMMYVHSQFVWFTNVFQTDIESIAIRNILRIPNVYPIIGKPSTASRPAERKYVLDKKFHPMAAETLLDVNALAMEPNGGYLVKEVFNVSSISAQTRLDSGLYNIPMAATMKFDINWNPIEAPKTDRQSDELTKRYKLSTHALSDIDKIQNQMVAALDYYFSGAATAVVMSRNAANFRKPRKHNIVKYLESKNNNNNNIWFSENVKENIKNFIGRLSYSDPVVVNDKYDINLIGDLYRLGALRMLIYITVEGKDSYNLDEFLSNRVIMNAKKTHDMRQNDISVAKSTTAMIYISIIEDKFGAARFKQLIKELKNTLGTRVKNAPGGSMAEDIDNLQLNNPEAIVELLSKKEKDIVITTYDNIRKEWASTINNKCPHVKLLLQLRRAPNKTVSKKVYAELELFFKDSAEDGWISCKNCNFHIICAHVRDKLQLENRNSTSDQLLSKLMKYATRISNNTGDYHTYYCRICGEIIGSASEDDDLAAQLGRYGNMDNNLRAKIWSTAMFAFKDLRFNTVVIDKEFANSATSALYQLVMSTEFKLISSQKRRKNVIEDEDNIDPRTHLYVIIFVYAYILNLIRTGDVGLNGVKPGAKLPTYAEHMVKTIIDRNKPLINSINVTEDHIKDRFNVIFSIVQNEGTLHMRRSNPEEELINYLVTFDAIYHYALNMAKIARDIPFNRQLLPPAIKKEFETIVGMDIKKLVKSIDTYSNLYEPKYDKKAIEVFNSLSVKRDFLGIEYYIGGGAITDIRDYEKGEFYSAYKLMRHYISKNDKSDYFAALETHRRCENQIKILKSYKTVRPYYNFLHKFAKYDMNIKITRVYDENGFKHKWNVYYYADNMVLKGINEVKAARANNTLKSNLVDVGCSICGVKLSEVDSIPEENVQQAVALNMNKSTFFTFFESRCPIAINGGMHKINKGKCVVCGYDTNMKQSKPTDYYKKYQKDYDIAKQSLIKPPKEKIIIPPPAKWSFVWKYDYTLIVETAKRLNVTTFLIEAIGNMDARPYKETVEGKNIPPLPTLSSDPRIYDTVAEVRLFLFDYSILCAGQDREWISDLIRKSELPIENYSALKILPDLIGDYYENLEYLRITAPEDAMKYSVQHLCHMILTLSKFSSGNAHINKLAELFAKREMELILRNQRLFCIHGPFDFAIFDGVEPDEAADEAEDADIDEVNDSYATFSEEKMDYDFLNDAD